MGDSDFPSSLSQFMQSAGELFEASAGNLDQMALSASEYNQAVEAVLANATPEFRALLARVGMREFTFLRHSPHIYSLTQVIADAGNGFDEQLAAFETRLEDINVHLDQLAKDETSAFEALSTIASSDFKVAINKLDPLVVLIQGDWKYCAEDASKAQTIVTELGRAFERATTSAKATSDKMIYYQAAFAQIRDADLLGEHGLEADLERFKTYIGSQITQTNQQLSVLDETLRSNNETLKNRQRNLDTATERYKKAASDADNAKAGETAAWILAWPVGLILHYTVSQDFIDDVSNAQKMVDQAKNQQAQVQADINSVQAQSMQLQTLLHRFQQFQADYARLEASVKQAANAAEAHRRASAQVGEQTRTTWGNVKATAISAQAAGWALSKVEYANVILTTLDDACFEKSIASNALRILNALDDQDDQNRSVATIHHPVMHAISYLQLLTQQYKSMV